MSTDVLSADPAKNPTYYLVEDEDHHHESGGSTAIGFWMYLMSDCLIFAILFATYGVLGTSYAGGPTPREIFELPLYEFANLIHEGAGPQRSAFLSSFFTLVGTHGLHVTFGSIWLVTLMVQVGRFGLIEANKRRLMCLSMFWHFLDVVWIGVFTFVYLLGVLR